MSKLDELIEKHKKDGAGALAASRHAMLVNSLQWYKDAIDEVFGAGYAAKNPGLVGAMYQGERSGTDVGPIAEALYEISRSTELSEMAQAVRYVGEAICGSGPDQNGGGIGLIGIGNQLFETWKSIGDVAGALHKVAESIDKVEYVASAIDGIYKVMHAEAMSNVDERLQNAADKEVAE